MSHIRFVAFETVMKGVAPASAYEPLNTHTGAVMVTHGGEKIWHSAEDLGMALLSSVFRGEAEGHINRSAITFGLEAIMAHDTTGLESDSLLRHQWDAKLEKLKSGDASRLPDSLLERPRGIAVVEQGPARVVLPAFEAD